MFQLFGMKLDEVQKKQNAPPVSHGANTSVEGDHIKPLLLLFKLMACAK